jgi:hydrogenase maturation protein HypF
MMGPVLQASAIEDVTWDEQRARWNIEVSGTVQGVGFRAFVFRLATRLGLRGFVASRPGALAIEIEGARASLGEFLEELWLGAPRRARIEQVSCYSSAPKGAAKFQIVGRD